MRLRALAVALAAASAHAEQEVALEYRAPEACPDRAHFVAQMADRGGRLQGTKSTERVAELAVAIEGSSTSGFAGTLLVTAPDGSSTSREIQDPDCAKVVTGLAVVGAIALFGTEDGESPAPALEDQTRSTRPTTTPRARPVEAPSPPEQEIRETALRGSSFGQPDSVEVSAGTLRFERARRITLSGGIDYGLVKELPMPRFDLRTSLGEFIVTPSGATRLVGPLLQVRWTLYGPGNRTEGGRESRALGFGAGVAVCSAFTYDDRGLSLLGCSEFDVGSMTVETTEADGTSRKTHRGFGTAGLALDAEYSLGKLVHVGLRLGARLQVGAIDAKEPAGQEDSGDALLFGGDATAGIGIHF